MVAVRLNLDVDALRSFVLGVDLGSFSRAAERVGRSTSAVSEQMAKLEVQLGRPLLRKQGRGLVPTDAGETLLGYGRRLLELNDEAIAAVRDPDLEGWVRLGLPQDFAEHWLPEVLGRFSRLHPRVRIEARAERNSELVDRVGAGKLDLALAWGEPEGLHAERLAELPICWIGPANRDVQWPAGEPLPLVVFESPCRFRTVGLAALDAAGIPWRLAFTSLSLASLWAAVAAGLGVSIRTPIGLPPSVRRLDAGQAGLPLLPSISLSLHAADADQSPSVARLTQILRDTLAEVLADMTSMINPSTRSEPARPISVGLKIEPKHRSDPSAIRPPTTTCF